MVYAAEGHAVGFEGPGYEESALGEVAQENDTFAPETAGEENEDCAGLKGFAVFGGMGGFTSLVGGC